MPSSARLILAFDTSAAHCAAALVQGADTLARDFAAMGKGQAEALLPMLQSVLTAAGRTWNDLDALGVCTGPGNFTGLRVGVAAARGLALALGIPAVGVTRLAALAAGQPRAALVTLDAGRDGLYAQTFRDGGELAPPVICHLSSLPVPPPGARCLGHRAAEVAAQLGLAAGPATTVPDTAAIARLAAARLARQPPPPRPAPLYLRPPDAAPPSEPAPVILDDA